ncbi:MAG: hypothetical protein JRD94_16535 [Deltaproteobacteria bacterium]|nr:hypothetical protein [Deltaproteobacteria bacterium]
MSRAGLILAGVLAVLFWAAGCSEETKGGGAGSGGTAGTGGSAGTGGTAGTGGAGGIRAPVVCGSFWEQPADAPIVSTECTYNLDATPPVRDCTAFDRDGDATLRVIREYADESVPCGYPCVTGNMPTGQNTGDHFDAALRPIVETGSFGPDGVTLLNRTVATVDEFGNLEKSELYDGDGNLTATATTSYTGDPAKPATFETRLSNNMLVSSGTMMWNAMDQLEAFEVLINVGFIPTGFNIEENPEELIGTYDFAYPFPQVTVTYVLPDATVISILTYDFVCPP